MNPPPVGSTTVTFNDTAPTPEDGTPAASVTLTRNASNLNYVTGQTVPNAVIAPVSATGEVYFFSLVKLDLIADINGWFAS